MPIPQTQFETWSHQGSITGSRTTYATIREALVAGTAEFSGRNTTVFLQGSYGNDTNIYAESDVDVVIGLHSTFFHDTSALTPVDLAVVKAGFRPATYQYADFKKHVTVALKQKFGDAVRPGEKAIKVTGNQYRRNADVIVATEFRKYYSPAGIIGATLGPQHIEGICFFTAANQQVVNYPKQHSANCTEKHQGTSGRFKPMVRIFKNMRSRLHEMGVIEPGSAPSYFIEGLLFNVPNDRFVASLRDSFVGCLKWILEAEPSNFVCANKEYLLVKDAQPNCWPCDQFDKFKKEAVKLWNNWCPLHFQWVGFRTLLRRARTSHSGTRRRERGVAEPTRHDSRSCQRGIGRGRRQRRRGGGRRRIVAVCLSRALHRRFVDDAAPWVADSATLQRRVVGERKTMAAYYRTGQAAKALGVSDHHVRRLCDAGLIEAELTERNHWRIPASEIDRLTEDGVPELPARPPERVTVDASESTSAQVPLIAMDATEDASHEVPQPSEPEPQKPVAEPPKPAPASEPVRKPVQSVENTPHKGSVPRRK